MTQETNPIPTPIPTPETVNPIQESPQGSSSFLRIFLIAIALILFGILVGVLASRFIPLSYPQVPVAEITPAITPTEEATPTATPNIIVTPTATPSALLDLKWTKMTVKSPVSFYHSYQIFYPSTWTIKTYKNTPGKNDTGSSNLTLVKGPATMVIQQILQPAPQCSFPGDNVAPGEGVVQLGDFNGVFKSTTTQWRWALRLNTDTPIYTVCGSENDQAFVATTSIGLISLTGQNLDAQTLDEFNYMLEKIQIQ